ncbi:MAG: tetraacyldisaccharide 4'-kinase [Desulfonatronovibrio sp. MSAO_Bac4]|nr:MAG: tetraacyldisaccharide 4'-kinase [Desulfonatronovibrio sp. MSAO_Bac4]
MNINFKKALFPLSLLYSAVVQTRQTMLSKKAVKLPRPVISVGNISMGGTGKTPMCQFLADYQHEKRKSAVILTRGYKARPKSLPHLVSTTDIPEECGDEPLLLARSLKNKAHIIVDPDRVRAANWAMDHLSPDIFILDDGFQHLKVQRDKDIVILTPHDLESGWNRVFPYGKWRENKNALQRANFFFINLWGRNIDDVKKIVRLRPELGHTQACYFNVQICGLKNIETKEIFQNINSRPYIVVTGIANPEKVVKSAESFLGYYAHGHLPFPDHHSFENSSLKAIKAMAREAGVQDVICTSKDAVKLKPIPGLKIWETETKFMIMDGMKDKVLKRIFQDQLS